MILSDAPVKIQLFTSSKRDYLVKFTRRQNLKSKSMRKSQAYGNLVKLCDEPRSSQSTDSWCESAFSSRSTSSESVSSSEQGMFPIKRKKFCDISNDTLSDALSSITICEETQSDGLFIDEFWNPIPSLSKLPTFFVSIFEFLGDEFKWHCLL